MRAWDVLEWRGEEMDVRITCGGGTYVRSLARDDIERRLDDRFRLLMGGARTALPHHRTLEGLVAWSHNLLDERERALFDRCGVFAGGFDLQAVEAVGALAPLESALADPPPETVSDEIGPALDTPTITDR